MTPLLASLVDDAGLFPPSSLPMADALERHRSSRHPMLSARFLCPADRVDELLDDMNEDEKLEIHLIGDDIRFPTDPRLTVRAVEVRAAAAHDLPSYVEGVAPSELSAGTYGKLRCGGVRTPPVDEVAHYLSECVRHGVAFKATAGMHAAVRGWESTEGQPHHGYLNLLLAVARAISGGDVEAVLASTDADSLAAEAKALDLEAAAATRALLHSYGSCDTDRPIRDAEKLGLL